MCKPRMSARSSTPEGAPFPLGDVLATFGVATSGLSHLRRNFRICAHSPIPSSASPPIHSLGWTQCGHTKGLPLNLCASSSTAEQRRWFPISPKPWPRWPRMPTWWHGYRHRVTAADGADSIRASCWLERLPGAWSCQCGERCGALTTSPRRPVSSRVDWWVPISRRLVGASYSSRACFLSTMCSPRVRPCGRRRRCSALGVRAKSLVWLRRRPGTRPPSGVSAWRLL